MSEEEPIILGPEHAHLLHGMLSYLRQMYISAQVVSGFPDMTIDYIDIHLPRVPMTLRVPIDVDGSFAQQVLDIAPPRKQQVKKVDKLGLLPPPKAGQQDGEAVDDQE